MYTDLPNQVSIYIYLYLHMPKKDKNAQKFSIYSYSLKYLWCISYTESFVPMTHPPLPARAPARITARLKPSELRRVRQAILGGTGSRGAFGDPLGVSFSIPSGKLT